MIKFNTPSRLAIVAILLALVLYNHQRGQTVFGWATITMGRTINLALTTVYNAGYTKPVCMPGGGRGLGAGDCATLGKIGCFFESVGAMLAQQIQRAQCPISRRGMVVSEPQLTGRAPWHLIQYALNWRWAVNGVTASTVLIFPLIETVIQWSPRSGLSDTPGLCAARHLDSAIILWCYIMLVWTVAGRHGRSLINGVARQVGLTM